jgi:gliding motility-associated-like protein
LRDPISYENIPIMPKLYKLTICLLVFHLQVIAQYADIGAGPLKNRIWWLNWANTQITNGTVKTFTTSTGLTLTCTVSGVSGATPVPGIMNAESGALLRSQYDFANLSVQPALTIANTSSYYTMRISASRNGLPAPFMLVAADAASTTGTESDAIGSSNSNWQTLNLYSNGAVQQPVNGCGIDTITFINTVNTCPVMGLYSDQHINLTVKMLRSDSGTSALAFGLFEPVDRGSLPATYGYVQHLISYTNSDSCTLTPSLTPITPLYLGANPPTPEATENAADEDSLTIFPDYSGNGIYTLNVPVTNTTGHDTYLSAWFDNNRNGYFEPTEGIVVTVPDGATSVPVNWTNLPAAFISGKMASYAFRFRLASNQSEITGPSGYASDGEVEDYLVAIKAPCVARLTTLADVTICQGKRTQLSATGISTFHWSPAAGLSSDTTSQPVAMPDTTTTYTIEGADIYGCPGKAATTVYVNPTPVLTPGKDTFLCTGTSIPLHVQSSMDAVVYSWSPLTSISGVNSASPMVFPLHDTSYTVTATTVYSCSSTATINLKVYPSPVFGVTPDTPFVCIGQSVSLQAKGGDTFKWMTGPQDTVIGSNSTIRIAPVTDSVFKVFMTQAQCQVSDTVIVPVTSHAVPITSIKKSSDIDCAHPKAQLTATGGVYYVWEPAPGLENETIASPVVSPLATTTYQVTVKDKWGCSNVETITVDVDIALTFTRYPLPSAFSPNGDGVNDCFGLKYWGNTDSFDFIVYNRDGRMVFTSHTPDVCWDGTYKGTPLPMGTYIYMIRARTVCGDVLRKGTVLLLR